MENFKENKKIPSSRSTILRFLGIYFFISELLIVCACYFSVKHFLKGLPVLAELEQIHEKENLSTIVYSQDNVELRTFQKEKRFWVKLSPTTYNPRSTVRPHYQQLEISKRRRNIVLNMMVNEGKIPYWRAQEEKAKPIELAALTESDFGKAPYFIEHIKTILNEKYGEEFVTTSGSKVYATINYQLQLIAEQALEQQLDYIQKTYVDKIPYSRPENVTNEEAFVDSLKKKVVEGALIAIEVKTGAILAMVGGRNFSQQNWFNRATQALRGAGSAFKVFLYTAALDNEWRCCDTIYDGYYSIELPDGTLYEPRNFEEEHLGVLSLRDGFKKSVNTIAVKLMNDTDNRGIGPNIVKKYARKMGITTYIPEVPSIAIGTPEVKLIEMVSAYTIFPNFGIKTENFPIRRIFDKNNTLIFSQDSGLKSDALSPQVASLMLTMLRSVTTEGTGAGIIKAKGMQDRPCAGKTGTGQDYKDAWFIGFTPYIACGVWVGFDSEETTLKLLENNRGLTGATAALGPWVEFIDEASNVLDYPKKDFILSSGITIKKLCKDSYHLATNSCPEDRIYNEYFIQGTEIKEYCEKHGPGKQNEYEQRFTPKTRKDRLRP